MEHNEEVMQRTMEYDRGNLKVRHNTVHLVRQLEALLVHDYGEMVSTQL